MTGSSSVWIRPASGQLRRAVDLVNLAVGGGDPVQHARGRRDQVLVELPLEPLLHDLHVEQAEKAAPEPEAERGRRLRLVEERGVVQPQLLERVAQLGILVPLDRVEPGEHHRLQLLEAGERLGGRPRDLGDRVAELRVRDALDARGDEPDLADAQLLERHRLRRERADFLDQVLLPEGHQPDTHALADHAVNHPDDDDDPAVGVVPGVEDQRLERRVRHAGRGRQPVHDRLEDVLRPGADLGARQDGVAPVEADDVLDLPAGFLDLRPGQVDLVDDRDDLEVVVHREVRVRQRLRLDALRGVDDQDGALAGGQRPRHLVREVHVARRVDQVQNVGVSVLGRVGQADRVRLDRDAPLLLEVHAVEQLGLHLPRLHGAGQLEEPVRERRLAMVDVRDHGEVADEARIHGDL